MHYSNIKYQIEYLKRNIQKNEDKLIEDFLYYLPWVGEDLWKEKYKVKFLQYLLDLNESNTDDEETDIELEETMLHNVKSLTEQCMKSYNVRSSSTSVLHTETSVWKFQCDLELVQFMSGLLKEKKQF